MNVTLYAICKNEEKNVNQFIEQSKKFYDTVVVDTGSTDNTVNLLREAKIKVFEHPQSREEFDFSLARNQALSYVETDWCFSLDFNEIVEDFYPIGFESLQDEFTAFTHIRYDDNGNEDLVESKEIHTRFHRKENYKWINSVHEIPVFVQSDKFFEEKAVSTTIKITKKINKTVDKELFYLSICEREFEKDNNNWYYNWFILNHYFSVKNYDLALQHIFIFLNSTVAYFNSFRIDAFIKASICFLNMNKPLEAVNNSFHALSEAIKIGEPSLSNAFLNIINLSKILNEPNLLIFATAFNPETKLLPERSQAIDQLFLTNLDDIPTCWRGHREFAEWLIQEINPNTIVDLGVDWGFSTLSFAIPRIGHVYGIDTFEGDSYTGANHGSYEYVSSKIEKLFLKENVTLIKGLFDDVAKTWNKKIDILHIDGSHSYEDIKNDYETWSKFLSEDGVILLHDTCVSELNGNIYGVKKFFEELDVPKITFTHSFGLGVISNNKQLIQKIKETFNL